MENVDCFEIDGKNYAIISEIKNDGFVYYYLGNIEDKTDITIKKEKADEPGTLYPLDDVDEVNKVLDLLKERLIENFNS